MTAARIAIGVVGLGYWGPNLARNFAALPGAELSWLCEEREDVRERFGATFQQARTTRKLDDLLWDPALDAVVLATPVAGHAELSVRVLEAGKRRLVEKPPATR